MSDANIYHYFMSAPHRRVESLLLQLGIGVEFITISRVAER